MNKVITISLNSNAYQLEEAGYEALQQYLKQAAAKLHDNPDKEEIMADFEQAIADKCAKYLKNQKNVIASKEIDEVLAEMGPVEDVADAEEKAQAKTAPAGDAPKRLFKIREGAVFEGVCNGIAAYANVDVTIVRILFIILTVLTWGAWIAVYILMAIFMPEARTAEDMATAQGKEFNAKTVINGARERYEYWKKFGEDQTKDWKEHKAEYKKEWKNWKYEYKKGWKQAPLPKSVATQVEQLEVYNNSMHSVSRGFAGIVGAIGVFLIIALNIVLAFGFYGLFTSGTIFGYFGGASKLVLTGVLIAGFMVALMPLQGITGFALRSAKGFAVAPRFWSLISQYLVWLGAIACLVLFAVNMPEIRDGFVKIYQDMANAHWFGL